MEHMNGGCDCDIEARTVYLEMVVDFDQQSI